MVVVRIASAAQANYSFVPSTDGTDSAHRQYECAVSNHVSRAGSGIPRTPSSCRRRSPQSLKKMNSSGLQTTSSALEVYLRPFCKFNRRASEGCISPRRCKSIAVFLFTFRHVAVIVPTKCN